MERTIQNPYKTNNMLYLILLFLSVIGIAISYINKIADQTFFEILRNLCFGGFASSLIAWLIDIASTKVKNKKANAVYDFVYGDLKFYIQNYLDTWARITAVAFKEFDDTKNAHTWIEWFNIAKGHFYQCDEVRQARVLQFFIEQLQFSTDEVNKSIQRIVSQYYLLAVNDTLSDDLKSIVNDFQFEFDNNDLRLFAKDGFDEFWKWSGAIQHDIEHYISNWKDIKFYNYIAFKPYHFFDDKKQLLDAISTANRENLKAKNN